MADDASPLRRESIKSSGCVIEEAEAALTVGKERRESLVRVKRLCQSCIDGDGDGNVLVLDNDMIVDDEQSVLDAQTHSVVDELMATVSFQGKGSMQKRVGALRKLRRLLSRSEYPPVEAAVKAGAISLLVQCLAFGSPDEQLLEASWCLTNTAAGKVEETKALLPALPMLIAHVGVKCQGVITGMSSVSRVPSSPTVEPASYPGSLTVVCDAR